MLRAGLLLLLSTSVAFGQMITDPVSPSVLSGRGTGLSVATTNYFVPFQGHAAAVTSPNEALIAMAVPFPAIASNLNVTACGAAPSAGHTTSVALRVNGATSALLVVIADAAVSGTDFTHTVALNANDTIDVVIVTNSGGTVPGNCIYSMQLTPR